MSQTTNFVRTIKPLSYKLITQAVLHVIELPFGNVISLLGKLTTGNYNAQINFAYAKLCDAPLSTNNE